MRLIKDIIECTAFLTGIGGLAGACEGQGSFLVSLIVFAIGFGMCLYDMKRLEERDKG